MSESDTSIAEPAPAAAVSDGGAKGRIDALIDSGAAAAKAPEKKPPEAKAPAAKEPEKTPEKVEIPEGESLSDSSVDDEIASLATDEEKEEQEKAALEIAKKAAETETLDAKKLAEKLGVSIEEIYDIKFPYGEDGDAITLGELKDAGIRARTIDDETETLSNERNSFVNEQMKSRAELQSIVALLPDGIPPELVNQANYQRQIAVDRERSSLLEVLPAWQDQAIEKIARDAMADNLKQYGFQPIEIENMLDHRLVKLIHDFTRMRQKIIKPMAHLQKQKKKRSSRGNRKPKGQEQVQLATEQGKTDLKGAINTLLPRG